MLPIFSNLKNYIIYILLILLAISVLLLSIQKCENKQLKAKNKYLTSKTNNSNVIQPNNQKNFKKEIKELIPEKELKEQGIKTKNINQITKTVVKDSLVIHTAFKDSIINDTVKIYCLNYSDKYNSVIGCTNNNIDSIQLKIQSKDTLYHIIHNKPTKKILFIKYKKEITLETINKNKNIKYQSITIINPKKLLKQTI